ncbi:MAG: hypothetical protein ABIW58_09050 [Sphingomicrobium sp.]
MAATNAANTHPEGRATALSINSGQSANAVMYGMPKPDLADYRKAVKGDGVSLYVFGTVWYNDAFKRPRYTNFCFEAEALLPLERAKVGQLENSGYSMTPFHNDSN